MEEKRTDRQVDLFLIGKTGNGKSATGNAITGRDAFAISDSSISATFVIQSAWSRFQGRLIKVVDGPGLCETRLSGGEAAEKLTKDMYQGMMQCPDGFHALVLVLKYGNRYTDEERKTLANLKALFGENFVRDFCILIFTHGENFVMNHRRNPKQFSDWLKEQQDSLKELLEEVKYRAVLFYNCDEVKYEQQLTELLKQVDALQNNGARYTNELFAQCAKDRERLIVENNVPELQENIQKKIDLLVSSYEDIKDASELSDDIKRKLELLRADARDLKVEIEIEDKGTGLLDNLRKVVMHITDALNNKESTLSEKKSQCAEIEALRKENEIKKLEFNDSSVQILESLMGQNQEMMKIFMDQQNSQSENIAKLIMVMQQQRAAQCQQAAAQSQQGAALLGSAITDGLTMLAASTGLGRGARLASQAALVGLGTQPISLGMQDSFGGLGPQPRHGTQANNSGLGAQPRQGTQANCAVM